MEKNDVHLVIGNELATRYEKVFVLSRSNDVDLMNSTDDNGKVSVQPNADYRIDEVTAAHGLSMMSSSIECNSGMANVDALECATIEYVARRHFHYISTTIHHMGGLSPLNLTSAAEMTARCTLEAASMHEDQLSATYRQLQRERIKVRVFELVWNAAGSLLGMALSYGIARMMSGRQHGRA
jgi:aromatic ring hydroxylase